MQVLAGLRLANRFLASFAEGFASHLPIPMMFGYDFDGYLTRVNIQLFNSALVTSEASFWVLHDRELTGQVYGYDPDGDAITAQLVSGPSHGTLTFHADGSFTYISNTHYLGALEVL